MVLANQNAKLTGPDQGFLVSSSYESPGNEVVFPLYRWFSQWFGNFLHSPFSGQSGFDLQLHILSDCCGFSLRIDLLWVLIFLSKLGMHE